MRLSLTFGCLALSLLLSVRATADAPCSAGAPVASQMAWDGRVVPADLLGLCFGPGGKCPTLQWRGLTYVALPYRDNRLGMAIIAFDANRQVVGRFDKSGARNNLQIFVSCAGQVQFVGQIASVLATWTELQIVVPITAVAMGGTISGGGLSCGPNCVAQLPVGVPVAFTATPGTGGAFVAWSGACAGQTTPQCVVTPAPAPLQIGATFTVPVPQPQ